MPKKFLTVSEVAKIIGVTPLTVRNWDKGGKLAAYRNPFNNYRLYKIEDIENLLKKIDISKNLNKTAAKKTSKPRKLTITEE